MASAIADTIVDTLVTREYLDLRISEIRLDMANVKADILKWVLGAIGFQTLAVIGGRRRCSSYSAISAFSR